MGRIKNLNKNKFDSEHPQTHKNKNEYQSKAAGVFKYVHVVSLSVSEKLFLPFRLSLSAGGKET